MTWPDRNILWVFKVGEPVYEKSYTQFNHVMDYCLFVANLILIITYCYANQPKFREENGMLILYSKEQPNVCIYVCMHSFVLYFKPIRQSNPSYKNNIKTVNLSANKSIHWNGIFKTATETDFYLLNTILCNLMHILCS